jgi:ATP-dependent DNA ligase
MIYLKDNMLIDKETGEILSKDITPRFQGLTFGHYRSLVKNGFEIRHIDPMRAEEQVGDKLEHLLDSPNIVAEKKWDGHRALGYITKRGNRFFSRGISKESGWYSENSDNMPHLRDIPVRLKMHGTVIDGEITLPIQNCTHREVQGVTCSLPETALATQLEKGFAVLNAFDILYYQGVNIQKMPYWKRKVYLLRAIKEIGSEFIKFCTIYTTKRAMETLYKKWNDYLGGNIDELTDLYAYVSPVDDYEALFAKMVKSKDEGIILKDINAPYEQKRSKNFTKMKAHNTYDVVIMGYEEPTEKYNGDNIETWMFWEVPGTSTPVEGLYYKDSLKDKRYKPVSKFYALDWIGAIRFGVWKNGKLVQVGRCSGLSDELRAEISYNKEKYIDRVIEVEAMRIISKETGSLENPRFLMFRDDKNSKDCTFNDHIRKYGEDKK